MLQQYRITFRSEIFITAKSKEEAEQKFEQIELFTEEARNNGASYVETNSVDHDGWVVPRSPQGSLMGRHGSPLPGNNK